MLRFQVLNEWSEVDSRCCGSEMITIDAECPELEDLIRNQGAANGYYNFYEITTVEVIPCQLELFQGERL